MVNIPYGPTINLVKGIILGLEVQSSCIVDHTKFTGTAKKHRKVSHLGYFDDVIKYRQRHRMNFYDSLRHTQNDCLEDLGVMVCTFKVVLIP